MKFKHIVRYPFDIRKAGRCLAGKTADHESNSCDPIVLDLHTDLLLFDCGRHLACLAQHARKIQSPLILRCDRWLLAAIAHKSHGPAFLKSPNVSWVSAGSSVPSRSLVLADVSRKASRRGTDASRRLQMLVGQRSVDGVAVMPYPMHPKQIESIDPGRLSTLRSKSKAGVFFAGNQQSRYGRESMREKFDVMSRLEILESLRSAFPNRIEAFEAAGDTSRIVLRDSSQNPIQGGEWMNTLADHQFFLCCPGASQPVCHNLIEAISVGSIPIIEYGDRIQPGLVDGVNAICFRGPDGLEQAIRRIDSMDQEAINQMRKQAETFYDQNLDGARFLKALRDQSECCLSGFLAMPFHDRDCFDVRSVQASSANIAA